MHVIYADPGLIGNFGHHANSCRAITAALRARGHDVDIMAHHAIDADLAAELGATPHFSVYTYEATVHDPHCGWLLSFFTSANMLAEDLARLGPFTPGQLIYLNSAQYTQLMAVRNFLLGLPDSERPQVCVEFGTGPGLDYVQADNVENFITRDPRVDSRAILYRFAGLQIKACGLTQLHLNTFDRTSSKAYSALLGLPVQTLPVPRFTDGVVRRRGAQRPITIGILGHQRGEKGYQLVPEIVRLLLRARGDVRFLVHSAQPNLVPMAQEEMRAMAENEPRILLDERTAGHELWEALLDQCDLMLCPYDPVSFRAGYSAVACESIAHAIPLVVPAHTTLSRILAEFGSPGIAFDEQTGLTIATAVYNAVEAFDVLADRAVAAAELWRTTMGAGAMVDAMLGQIAGADMLTRLRQRVWPTQTSIPIQKVA